MSPSCSTMPPISCTSKWRWPSVRLAASRTVAKAGTRMSSSVLRPASSGRHSAAQGVAPSFERGAEFGGAGLQRLVGERRDLGLQGVDGIDAGLISLDPPVVGGAEKLAGERADHAKFLSLPFGVAAVKWSTGVPINSS